MMYGLSDIEVLPFFGPPGDRVLQHQAIKCLGKPEHKDALNPLIGLYDEFDEADLLDAVAEAIAKIDKEEALNLLIRSIASSDPAYRGSSVKGLAILDGEDVIGEIASLRYDGDRAVMRKVDEALGAKPYDSTRTYLLEMLRDRDCDNIKRALAIVKSQTKGRTILRVADSDKEELEDTLLELTEDKQCSQVAEKAGQLLSSVQKLTTAPAFTPRSTLGGKPEQSLHSQ